MGPLFRLTAVGPFLLPLLRKPKSSRRTNGSLWRAVPSHQYPFGSKRSLSSNSIPGGLSLIESHRKNGLSSKGHGIKAVSRPNSPFRRWASSVIQQLAVGGFHDEIGKVWKEAAEGGARIAGKWTQREKLDASCLIITKDGKMDEVLHDLQKADVCKEFGLQPRDLRTLDSHTVDLSPSILVRPRCILVSSPIIRAIVTHDRILIIDSKEDGDEGRQAGDSRHIKAHDIAKSVLSVLQYLNFIYGKNTNPFELRALEAILILGTRGYRKVAHKISAAIQEEVLSLRTDVSHDQIRRIIECKRAVDEFLSRAKGFQTSLASVLKEDDEDLAGLYLTAKHEGKPRDVNDHEEAELLLESYLKRMDEAVESLEQLSLKIQSIESSVDLVLAATRNRLLYLDIALSVTMTAFAVGNYVAALFGMNLITGWEEHPTAFWTVTGSTGMLMSIAAFAGARALVHARRSKLSVVTRFDRPDGKLGS